MLSLLLTSALLLQLKDSRSLQYSYHLNIAATQLFSMLQRLKLLAPNQRQIALIQWNQQNTVLLPHSRGQLHCHKTCSVDITWGSKNQYKIFWILKDKYNFHKVTPE